MQITLCCVTTATAEPVWLPPFGDPAGALAAPWEPLRLPKRIARAATTIVLDDQQRTLQIAADNQAGGAFLRLPKIPGRLSLSWAWRISRTLIKADLQQKAADDFAARVYVMFDYPLDRLSYLERLQIKLARSFYDPDLPLATLCYVWDNRHSHETLVPSSYTDRVRLIVLRNRDDAVDQWLSETRDLAADFRRAFAEDPPPVIGLAFAADTDNTAEQVTAWFKTPRLQRR